MSHFAIAGLQLVLKGGDNLSFILGEIRRVKLLYPWVDMVVLSELASCGANPAHAQVEGGEYEKAYCEIAKALGIWLVPGSIYVKEGEHVYNMAPVISNTGELIARYRKIYPFLPYEVGVSAGKDFVVFDIPDVGCFGVSICYDKWFPETTRAMVEMGAEVILHPTFTNTMDRDVELAITRSSAATNQCYFFDINTATPLARGRSIVAGPGGEVIHASGEGQDIFAIDIDLAYLRRVREKGWQGLGQVLKSFRDAKIEYPQYQKEERGVSKLNKLGELKMPTSKQC